MIKGFKVSRFHKDRGQVPTGAKRLRPTCKNPKFYFSGYPRG